MRYFALSLLLMSQPGLAAWYESTGVAKIRNNGVSAARTLATEDAIKQALIFSGAKVTSIQSLANGVWQGETVQISQHGAVERIEVVDEIISGDTLQLTLRLNIFAEERTCLGANVKKSLVTVPAQLQFVSQAQVGQIFNLASAIDTKLAHSFSQQNQVVQSIYRGQSVDISPFFAFPSQTQQAFVRQIAEQNNSHYVMFNQINDISLGDKQNSAAAFWQDDAYERYYSMQSIIYDGFSGEKLWQESFQTSGIWQYKKAAKVNVNSTQFWQQDWGSTILSLLSQVTQSVSEQLACEMTRGRILALNGTQLTLGLGNSHDLTKGQLFAVAHKKVHDLGQFSATEYQQSIYKVRITHVAQQTAQAELIGNEFLANVQINDVVTIVPIEPSELK